MCGRYSIVSNFEAVRRFGSTPSPELVEGASQRGPKTMRLQCRCHRGRSIEKIDPLLPGLLAGRDRTRSFLRRRLQE